MSWESWQRAWSLHAQTTGYNRRKAVALDIVRQALATRQKLVVSLSGGKDSVAMAGLVAEAGGESVPLAYAHTAFNFPDTASVVDAVSERLSMDCYTVRPESDHVEECIDEVCARYGTPKPQPSVDGYDEWALLQAFPEHVNVDEGDDWEVITRVVAAGYLMTMFVLFNDFDGSFVGLRADESKARRWYARAWGPIHERKRDSKVQICPLLGWSALDVFAYCTERELPIHPYYRRAWELGPQTEPPDRLRVDLGLMRDTFAALGGFGRIARIYPDFARRVTTIRPEMMRYL